MEITRWIAKATEWDGHVHDDPERDGEAVRANNKAVARQAISKAEGVWNSQHANDGVVEKVFTGDELKAAYGGEVVDAFVTWATA